MVVAPNVKAKCAVSDFENKINEIHIVKWLKSIEEVSGIKNGKKELKYKVILFNIKLFKK
jgi:hypothetical protein